MCYLSNKINNNQVYRRLSNISYWEAKYKTLFSTCQSSCMWMCISLNLIHLLLRDVWKWKCVCRAVSKLLSNLHLAAASPGSPGARRSSGRWWGPLCFSPGSLWTALSADGGWSSGPRRPAGTPYPGPRRTAAQPDAPPFEPSPEGRREGRRGRQLEEGGERDESEKRCTHTRRMET